MEKREYYDRCAQQDWFYAFADDPKEFWPADQEHKILKSLADSDPELDTIFAAFCEWRNDRINHGYGPAMPKWGQFQ